MHFVDENGDSLINGEHKLRIPLSEKALIIITEDMDVFGVPKRTTFINIIFCNFWEEAKASLTTYLQEKELELVNALKDTAVTESAKRIVIEQLLEKEKKIIEKRNEQYNHLKTENKLYHLSKETINILENICNEGENYSRPSQYIRYVIEEYCALPFIERERIFRKPIYDLVEEACMHKRVLQITQNYNGKDVAFDVYPYKIAPDTFHTQSYLVCYSRLETEDESSRIVASFSMARLSKVSKRKRTFHLNAREIALIEDSIANNSPAYLVGKVEQIQVRLTEKGKQSFRSRLYSRPEKVEALSSDDIYVFNCTQQQAFNYFFPFGADAEIISPRHLRNRFKNVHLNALSSYSNDTVQA